MLTDVINYSGIFAKISALRGDMLKYKDFERLAASEDVRSFGEALGEKESYKDAVREAFEFGGNRVALERSIVNPLYRDYAALYRFLNSRGDKIYLQVIFLKYAAGIIKRLIRRLYERRDIHRSIPKYGDFMKRHLGLNAEKIEESQNFDELLENVKGTEFYKVLSQVDRESATLFDYEMQLDFYCFIKTQSFQEAYLKKRDRASLRVINGSEIDLHNIMWIYRARKYYEISNDKIFTYMIPVHYMLSADIIKSLVHAADLKEFTEIIGKTHYKNVFKDLTNDSLERDFRVYMNKLHEEQRKKNPYSIVSVVAYFYFKGQEIRNLTTLIECVRYKLAPAVALNKINISYLADSPENQAPE